MAALPPESVRYLVVHTADFDGRDCDAEMINRWHRDPEPAGNGWAGIGYHYVILNDRHRALPDGTVEEGRPLDRRGSHVKGLNHLSLGICCVGKGDRRAFTEPQMQSLARLLADLMERFRVPLGCVIGHREVNALIDAGVIPERDARGNSQRTSKTCPGRKVDMELVRARTAQELALRASVADVPALVATVVPPSPRPPTPPPIIGYL